MNASRTLSGCLPADPGDDGPTGIADSADLRAVLDELNKHRLAHEALVGVFGDGGVLLEIDRLRKASVNLPGPVDTATAALPGPETGGTAALTAGGQ